MTRRRALPVRALATALALGWLALGWAAAPAPAQEPMQGWSPLAFEVFCGAPGDVDLPLVRDTSCIDDAVRGTVERMSARLAREFARIGFSPPRNLRPVVAAHESDGDAVRIFTEAASPPQWAQITTASCDASAVSNFFITPANLATLTDHVLSYIVGHEIFHTVQKNFAGHMRDRQSENGCMPPFWIGEGMADAAAHSVTARLFPQFFPPTRFQRGGHSYVGLRPYHRPLFDMSLPAKLKYRTSSFWRWISDRFHGGRLRFLEDYAMTPPPDDGAGGEDWLAWLNGELRKDPRVATPLYLAYPAFLTHFAGEFHDRGEARHYGREYLLENAFGGCETLTLTPEAPYATVDLAIAPMAGRCLAVQVEDLEPGQRATVKVGASGGGLDKVDAVHLGFAFSTDETGFNCAALTRRGGLPDGVPGCLLEPVTGEIGGVRWLRMWHASAVESGAGATQAAAGDGGALENVYVLSRVPPAPRLAELEAAGPETFTVAAGLDLASLEAEGQPASSGPASRKAKRRRAAGGMGIQDVETDSILPPSSGYVDMGPLERTLGPEVTGMASQLSELVREHAGPVWGGIASGYDISLFSIGEVEVTPEGIVAETLERRRSIQVLIAEELPEGTTGTYEAFLVGGNREAPHIAYMSEEEAPAEVTVLENSEGAFRARVSGRVCVIDFDRLQAAAMARRSIPPCIDRFQVSGEIVKPFAYLYRQASPLRSIRTEGEALYNEFHSPRLALGGLGGGGGNGGGGGGGGGGAVDACDCACERRAAQPAACQPVCAASWADCPASEDAGAGTGAGTGADEAEARAERVREAQIGWFSRLLGERDLTEEVRDMLIEDFAGQSERTRRHLIRRYRAGDG